GFATPGAHQTSYGGGTLSGDGFLAKFTSSGNLVWCTYYGGNSDEIAGSVGCDPSGNVYLCGTTQSATNISTSGAHQVSLAGPVCGYVAKFNSAGVRQWGTYYGDAGNDHLYGMSVNNAAEVFVIGRTTSTSGIATVGSYQTVYGGDYDAFVGKFTTAGVL